MILDKSLNFSKPQLTHLNNEEIISSLPCGVLVRIKWDDKNATILNCSIVRHYSPPTKLQKLSLLWVITFWYFFWWASEMDKMAARELFFLVFWHYATPVGKNRLFSTWFCFSIAKPHLLLLADKILLASVVSQWLLATGLYLPPKLSVKSAAKGQLTLSWEKTLHLFLINSTCIKMQHI